ncbi:EAL domain-containing protein [Halomonas janggokensis]|uniref:EAL domain-containing protein n=1 Tax=Vreelandella janggokensis TaxID=370767 RepID=A0ABT4IR84_9GAMM|nr:GGDEF domain-containing protein [Halomonas janggokensis]MCZ0926181.1 EAL domain-containing protein [Halomonas janggokensis]MCZ0931248.1 EAL domain-containing protein [Halomonas janggokensis]
MSSTKAPVVFGQLADSLTSVSENGFFYHLVKALSDILCVDHVLLARFDSERGIATPLAFWTHGAPSELDTYAVKDTPCEQVVMLTRWRTLSGVSDHFPNDARLGELSAEGYWGMALQAPDGTCMGVLAIMHSSPLVLPAYAEEILRVIAILGGTELARQLTQDNVQARLRRKKRALQLMNRRHDLLMHTGSEQHLLQSACSLAVGIGGYAGAWVTAFTPDAGSDEVLSIEAMADEDGEAASWLSPAQLFISRYCKGLAERALQLNRPVVIERPNDETLPLGVNQALSVLGAEQVVALPLQYADKQYGVMTLYHRQSDRLNVEEMQLLEELVDELSLGIYSRRQKQAEARIQHAVTRIATAVSASSGEAFLHQLTVHMAEALSAEVGFIALLDEQDTDFACTLTLYVEGQLQDNFTYYLPGVPCHKVMVEQECIVHKDAAFMLPGETKGALSWVNGYVGRRLDNSHGQPMGLVGVMFKEPLAEVEIVRNVLQIFAARAASELERQEDESRIRQLAFNDTGTQLPNRAAFMRHLKHVLTDMPAPGLALLILDLNHFKEINDTAGHDLGDLVLKEVASRLAASLTHNEYLARLGGDEFVVVCPARDEAEALANARRLCKCIEDPFSIYQQSFELTVSVGISLSPRHATTPLDLLKDADIAIYQAKRQKLPVCVFEPWMECEVAEQLQIAKRLSNAITEKQLRLHFQPQVDLRNGKLIGAEALCRWHDEELGVVSPGKFIPIAEDRGMMVALGNWVIEEACRHLAQWHQQGLWLPGQLAINIAADQFEDGDLVRSLLDYCQQFQVEASMLSLEITESGIMVNPEKAIAMTKTLKGKGLGLAIDDFGTGYSSLAYLKRFAADKIKIDISFVRDMLTSDNDRVIVETIIAMATTLGLATIAEGIEHASQAEALLAMGCTQAQGYYFDRPLPADQFAERWLVGAQRL